VSTMHRNKLRFVRSKKILVVRNRLILSLLEYFRQLELRAGLLTCLSREQDTSLRARICDIVGDLAGEIMECNEWPEILSYSQSSIQVKNIIAEFLLLQKLLICIMLT
jgi:hypothetical protein